MIKLKRIAGRIGAATALAVGLMTATAVAAQAACYQGCLVLGHSTISSFGTVVVAKDYPGYSCASSGPKSLWRGDNTLSDFGWQDARCIYVDDGQDAVVTKPDGTRVRLNDGWYGLAQPITNKQYSIKMIHEWEAT
jgi:hypothetical protein